MDLLNIGTITEKPPNLSIKQFPVLIFSTGPNQSTEGMKPSGLSAFKLSVLPKNRNHDCKVVKGSKNVLSWLMDVNHNKNLG